ncbi:unnamed protein product [Prunus armeniaca]
MNNMDNIKSNLSSIEVWETRSSPWSQAGKLQLEQYPSCCSKMSTTWPLPCGHIGVDKCCLIRYFAKNMVICQPTNCMLLSVTINSRCQMGRADPAWHNPNPFK